MGVRPFYTCRLLRWRDAAFCYRLASDPEVRRVSRDSKRATWLGHLRWMWKWIRSPDHRAWAILSVEGRVYQPGQPVNPRWARVGLLRASRFDDGREGSEVGIAIHKDYRGKGIASGQLHDMSPLIYDHFDGPVYAFIKMDNTASVRTFMRAGYLRRWGSVEYGENAAMAKYWWRPGGAK